MVGERLEVDAGQQRAVLVGEGGGAVDREHLRRAAQLVAERRRPAIVAILGIEAYRHAFERKTAQLGEQEQRLGPARVWVLPNPSGLNAHYQLPDLVRVFGELARAAKLA